ncbi:FMN-binding negative transcriptional regulator [Pseudomonas sp. CGJS7]|uniref:FMN-binding negative transcriptional regulator n=1 Tax=Pseudomonas sp. CGJS7 TaxID=3109348 RepID=UPI003008EED3
MYLPRAFAEADLSALDALAARDNFVTLITVRDEEPTVSHLPVLYRREGERIEIRGHWAKPNRQAQHAGAGLMIFHGPHAYVSPSWYLDKEEQARVPTWNYAVAHLRGQLELFHDHEFLAGVVSDLSDLHEAAVGRDWRFEPERADHASQLRGIVGFRFVAEGAALKWKLSQNHPEGNRLAVATELAAQSREDSREIAAMMRAREAVRD